MSIVLNLNLNPQQFKLISPWDLMGFLQLWEWIKWFKKLYNFNVVFLHKPIEIKGPK